MQEVFLERHFSHMNPAAARLTLLGGARHRSFPGGLVRNLFSANELADVSAVAVTMDSII